MHFFRAGKTHRYQTIWLPSVLQEPRIFYSIQGPSLAKQISTWYRLLIFRAGLPKNMTNQSQVAALAQCVS